MSAAKAWAGGVAAWLGSYLIAAVEGALSTDIPVDVETAIVALIAAAIIWIVPNKGVTA